MSGHPYASAAYAEVFRELATPLWVPAWGSHVLVREFRPGVKDALGGYPLAVFGKDADLKTGLEWLKAQGLVSIGLVPDPATAPPASELSAAFAVCSPFKAHALIDYGREVRYSKHHRAEVKRALRWVTVREVNFADHLQVWLKLFGELGARRDVGGMSALSERAFEQLSTVEGLRAVAAFAGEEIVSMHLWILDAPSATGSSLFAASSKEGYAHSAAYAVYDASIRLFSDLKILNLGGGAGVSISKEDGLSRFKSGFANAEVMSVFCGAVLDDRRYRELAKGAPLALPFPAYRFPVAHQL